MFGSPTPFWQSSNSQFGSLSVFGQNSNTGSNPFTPKPFGSTTPFGSPTGGSVFGGTSTGVFGQNSNTSSNPFTPKPFGSTTPFGSPTGGSVFGGTSTGVFGTNSSPLGQHQQSTFGSPSPPTFGSTSSSFGGSTFGQKSAVGGFASNPNPSCSFASAFQQAQTTFGSSPFGSSTSFGAPSQNAFGASSTAFSPASTSLANAPAFGFRTGGALTAANTSGPSSTTFFGVSNTSAFGAPTTSAFGVPSTTGSVFGTTTPAFAQSTSASGSSTTPFTFGVQSSSGAQSTTPTTTGFGQYIFGSRSGGSRAAAYTATTAADEDKYLQCKLQSISAMHINKDKSHEELRWEDYQSGDKGGHHPVSQAAGVIGTDGSAIQSNPYPTLVQSPVNPFNSSTVSNPSAPTTSFTISSNIFPPQTSSPFNSSAPVNPFNSSTVSNQFAPKTLFNTSSNIFPPQTSSAFNSSAPVNRFNSSAPVNPFNPSTVSSPFAPKTTSSYLFSPQTSSAFNSSLHNALSSSAPSPFVVAPNPASASNSSFQFIAPCPQSSSVGPSIVSSFCLPAILNAPSTGSQSGGNLCSSTSSLLSTSNPASFSQTNPTQTTAVVQPAPIVSPFGALPAMPQLSVSRHSGSTPSIRSGISSLPVSDKPAAPLRMSSLLTSRHLSQRRTRLPVRKYDPKIDGPKVPFFSKGKDMPTAPKADAIFVPRENPRALVVLPAEQWPQKMSPLVRASINVYKNGKISAKVSAPALLNSSICQDEDDHSAVHSTDKENVADVEALMPRLGHSDYYTKPQIAALALKERSEPGFCSHVKDFVVGRHSYGSIKFLGETDVRQLDLDSHVLFSNREVIVYLDEREKPPVGKGLNKAAEVTLLNVKCIDKKTGTQYVNGPKVDRYREMLIKKAKEQGAEFVSYDPVEGEWKFRVQHFSRYAF